MRRIAEVCDEVLAEMALPPLVTVEDRLFTFYDRSHPNFTYDFTVADAADALTWVRHLAPKQWVTKGHLEAFASLCLQTFGGDRA